MLRPISAKRASEADRRWDVRMEALTRAKFRCEAPDDAFGVGHGGPLDVHEVVGRGVRPGSHLEEELTMVVCRSHHELIGLFPEHARELGLRKESWEVPAPATSKIVPRRS